MTAPSEPLLEIAADGVEAPQMAFLERVVGAVRTFVGRSDLRVSILFTDDARIAGLHGQFLGDPTPTDVMSFDLDGDAELVVSVETAAREAGRAVPVHHEVALYVVHGLLHLNGFDDIDVDDRARMRDAEREVLASIDVHVRRVDA